MNIKELLQDKFNIKINNMEVLGSGDDSIAYLVNNEYVFKIKYNDNSERSYKNEKAIYDFLNKYLDINIKIPNIEYSFINDEISILGYKKIDGAFLTPDIYNKLTNEEQDNLKQDIANFLKQMHSLDYSEIDFCKIDKSDIKKLSETNIYSNNQCLCHNDFSCNHLLLDENKKLCGIIDFGDAGITDVYSDFIYLLEDSEEEIGQKFGEEILKLYGNIDIEKAIEYRDIMEEYYS